MHMLAFLLSAVICTISATDKFITVPSSNIQEVVIYGSNVEIKRNFEFHLGTGHGIFTVKVKGLPSKMIDKTVKVEAPSTIELVGISIREESYDRESDDSFQTLQVRSYLFFIFGVHYYCTWSLA